MHAVVTEVTIHALPFATGEEDEPWDLFSGPDLFYEAYGPDGSLLHASEVAHDVGPRDLPVALDGGFVVEPSGPYVLRLLDEDLTGEEVVGRLVLDAERLVNEGRKNAFPGSICLEDQGTTVHVSLTWKEV